MNRASRGQNLVQLALKNQSGRTQELDQNSILAARRALYFENEHDLNEIYVSKQSHTEVEVLNSSTGFMEYENVQNISREISPSILSEQVSQLMTNNKQTRKCLVKDTNLVDYSSSNEDFSGDDLDADPTFQLPVYEPPISDESTEEINYVSPTRWSKRFPEKWKANITKENRAKCLPYSNKSKLCPAKSPRSVNCSRCRFDCTSYFTEEERVQICKSYWALNDYKRQKDFIINHVQVIAPKRRKVSESDSKSRAVSKSYYLNNAKGRFRVCAKFFEKTLCISNGPINTAIRGMSDTSCFEDIDHRGRKAPGNKISEETLALVKKHINSFPCVEAHYVRQSSKKKYLDPSLSIRKMHSLYVDFCKDQHVTSVTEATYRRIFCTSFNLSFHKPKKDQCAACDRYKTADEVKKKEMEPEHSMHLIRKNECNSAKTTDKNRAQTDRHFQTVTFDLQSVLHIPYSSVSHFYYTRKLCIYNLTFYEGDGKNAYCFTWNEVNGKRGSNEIGSIILKYIQTLPKDVKHLSLFSDTCGGQNRNQHVAAILLHAVQHTHLNVIEHKFLESGHSHMECDSMHSAIENARKHKSIFMMNDWLNIFKIARSKNNKNKDAEPYKVTELKYKDFWDLQTLAASTIKNRNTDECGAKVSWLKIKCLKFEKANPGIIFYKYNHSAEYKIINVAQRSRRSKNISDVVELKQAYQGLLPISQQKKKDLLKLCKDDLIPEELHSWYQGLPTSAAIPDNDVFHFEDENEAHFDLI